MPDTKHDKIAEQVAKRKGGEYNPSKGADIVTPQVVIEVEVDQGKLGEGIRQLQGYRRPRYLAVPSELVKGAKERTKNTQVGVMNETGQIQKKAGGKKGK